MRKMKRKIIKIADTTYVVSLPLKWVRERGIVKGQEVELQEENNNIIMSFGADSAHTYKYEIDVGNLVKVPDRYVTALYRRGVDEITIRYSQPKTCNSIQTCLSEQTIGMEIISQKKDFCVIKDLTGQELKDFQPVLRRIWLLIKEMAADSLALALSKDIDGLKNMFYRDRDINKFSNYCCRILLNDSSISDYKRVVYFHFIRNLEEVADSYKDFCLYYCRETPKLNEKIMSMFKRINTYYESFYGLFYNFNKEGVDEMLLEYDHLKARFVELHKEKGCDPTTVYYLQDIVQSIVRLLSTLLEINLELPPKP
jgi:phosphate uptake regulator